MTSEQSERAVTRAWILALFFLLHVALSLSCGSSGKSDAAITGDFVVRYDPIEGGCWGLVAADNAVYSPVNLDNAYRMDGLRVHASIFMRPDMAGYCPGALVEIIEITSAP
jgi:hypothetical protein